MVASNWFLFFLPHSQIWICQCPLSALRLWHVDEWQFSQQRSFDPFDSWQQPSCKKVERGTLSATNKSWTSCAESDTWSRSNHIKRLWVGDGNRASPQLITHTQCHLILIARPSRERDQKRTTLVVNSMFWCLERAGWLVGWFIAQGKFCCQVTLTYEALSSWKNLKRGLKWRRFIKVLENVPSW